jgi:periplasmic protein TonB
MWLRLGCLIFLICVAVPTYAQTDLVVQWKKDISDRLIASRRFPPEARGQTGSAVVGFVMDRSGELVSSWLRESTGSPALDTEALAMVDRARPFPAPPPEVDDLTFVLPVIFARRPPMTIDPIKEADIRKQDAAIREENSSINAKMRSLCRGC